MNKNNGKLLAAVIAMLMVVCAVAVVAAPSADAYDPVAGKELSGEKEVGSVAELEALATNGIIEVPAAGATITLTNDIGSDADAANVAFVLAGNLTIKSAEGKNYNLFITTDGTTVTSGTNNYSTVVYFNADNLSFNVENASVYLDNATDNNRTDSIFNSQYGTTGGYTATVSVKNADLTLSQSGSVVSGGSGSTWIAATGEGKVSNLKLENADLVCNGTAAFMDTVITTTGTANTIVMNDVEVGLVAADGSNIANLAYTVNGANVQGLAFKGKVTTDNSTFEVNDANKDNNASRAGVILYTGSAVTMDDDSKISADTVKVAEDWNGDIKEDTTDAAMPTVTGGTIDGATFLASTGAGAAKNAADYELNGTTLTGTNTVSEKVTLSAGADGITVADNLRNRGTVDTGYGKGLNVEGRFTNSADVTGTTAITGSGSVTNDTSGNMGVAVEAPGYVNNNTSEQIVYGDSIDTNWYPAKQNLTVPEGQTWTITNGNVIVVPGTLNVLGNLVIEEGGVLIIGGSECGTDKTRIGFGTANVEGTLTVEEGAVLSVAYGTLNIEGTANIDGTVMVGYGLKDNADTTMAAGFFDENGAIRADSEIVKNTKATVNVNSNTTLSDSSSLYQVDGAKIVVAQDVTLTLEGQFKDKVTFDNSGAIIIDSEPTDIDSNLLPCQVNININMMADGASVEVQKLAMATGGYLYITDASLIVKDEQTIGSTAGVTANGLGFSSSGTNSTISGLTVVENFSVKKVDGVDKITNVMDISGSIAADYNGNDNGNPAAVVELGQGNFTVSAAENDAAALSIGENTKLTISSTAKLTVSGYVPVSDKALNNGIVSTGTITLADAGHIYMPEFEIGGTVNAAHYVTKVNADDYSNYVTVDEAIAAANADSTIDEITLYGTNTVLTSATVPAIDFTFKDDKTVLNIGDEDNRDVRLDIAAGATYGRVGTTNVLGTLYFNDRTDLKAAETTIKADVVSKQVDADGKLTKNGWAKYTNIYTAMTEATAGDVINVFDATKVTLDKDFTVKEGVTLVIPFDSQIVINNGVTLTVAGTLQSDRPNEGIVAEKQFATKATTEKDKEASAIVVTGTLKVMEDVVYEASNTTKNTLDDGSYISGAYFTDGDYNYVTTVATAVSAAVLPTVLDEIVIYGTVSEGDTTFTATDDCAVIKIGAKAEVTLTSLVLANGAQLDSDAAGVFSGTVTVGDASIEAVKVKGLDVDSENGLVITGANVNYPDPNDKNTPKKNLATLNVTAGTVIVSSANAATAAVTGDVTVDADATLTVPATSTSVSATYGTIDGKLFVAGTVTVAGGQTLTVDDLFVAGTVTVAAADGTNSNGNLRIVNGIMYVGLDDEFAVTSTSAAVNGTVGCDTIYAAAGTTVAVDEDVFDNSTEYYVEDALWITAYTSEPALGIDGDTLENTIKAAVPVENAWFNGTWLDADGVSANEKSVGQVAAVYAQVKYDVYVINLRADQNAISSISIDNNIMQFGMISDGKGSFFYGYTAVVEAGAHTISYQLANGYSGQGVLSVDGVQQSGLTFTAEGELSTVSGYDSPVKVYNLQLSGFEKSGYVPDSPDTGDSDSGETGMTITDYLLIVLVVLIIVMAIIVAMRLMRS